MKNLSSIDWSVTQNLAYRIAERLVGFSRIVDDKINCVIQVIGQLPLGDQEFSTGKKARCAFKVDSQWVQKTPEVICLEPWIIRGLADWHIDENGRLCYEFDLNWEQELSAMVEQYTLGLTADYATQWLLNSTRSLLRRHLFASRNGITTWPKSWDFWPHERTAAEQQLINTEPAP